MQDAIKQLQQLKGVGAALAKRLVEAGLGTLPRLANATIGELTTIKGLPAAAIPALQQQARELAGLTAATAADKSLTAMLEDTERLRLGVASLVTQLRDHHAESDDGKALRQLRKEISRVLATLERVEATLSEQLLRLGKKLSKADARLGTAAADDLEALTKGLRHTRKAIDKVVRPC
jgi:hypothetical protein